MPASTKRIVEWLEGVEQSDRLNVVWVDTEAAISELVYTINCCRQCKSTICIVIERLCLSKKISTMQIYDAVKDVVYLVDLLTLGERCFTTPAKHKRTLKEVLEDRDVTKVFFDVRNDSRSLYNQYGIALEGIHEVQLMELATRSHCRGYVADFSTCVERTAPNSTIEMLRWINMTERGPVQLSVNPRRLSQNTTQYCVQKVRILSQLYAHYGSKLTPAWRERMISTSKDRVRESQSARSDDPETDMFMAPDGWHEVPPCPGALVKVYRITDIYESLL